MLITGAAIRAPYRKGVTAAGWPGGGTWTRPPIRLLLDEPDPNANRPPAAAAIGPA